MKYLVTIMFVSLFGCISHVSNSGKTPIPFEDNNHFPYNLTSGKFLVLENQQQMDDVFMVIHQKSGGKRMAPIPTIIKGETYLIFKPVLKNTNDVEIKEISTENNILHITLKEFNNPQIDKANRTTPNILVKLLKTVTITDVVLDYQK